MCQVMPAELSIVRFRDGLEPQHKSVCMQVTRTLEKHAKKQLRGTAHALPSFAATLVLLMLRVTLGSLQYQ